MVWIVWAGLKESRSDAGFEANHILGLGDKTEINGKKRFLDAMAAANVAYSLCSTLNGAKELKRELAFLSAISAVLRKFDGVDKKRGAEQKHSEQKQILDNAVKAEDVQDIFKMAQLGFLETAAAFVLLAEWHACHIFEKKITLWNRPTIERGARYAEGRGVHQQCIDDCLKFWMPLVDRSCVARLGKQPDSAAKALLTATRVCYPIPIDNR